MGLVDGRPVVCPNLAMGFWVPLQYFNIYPRVSEDHPDRSWMLQMGSLSPLSTTCTSRLLSFWNGRRS